MTTLFVKNCVLHNMHRKSCENSVATPNTRSYRKLMTGPVNSSSDSTDEWISEFEMGIGL